MKIFQRIVIVILLLFIAIAIVVGNTRPIDDGDTWWQMAYGKYMVENQTLIPDHTIYTWTPASGDDIYCAWIPEILLYIMYSTFGMWSLFILRYAVIVMIVLLLLHYAYKNNVLSHPLSLLSILMLTITYASTSASFVKPEMLSFLFMVILVWLWWYIRSHENMPLWVPYLFPLIMVVWVNSHGGFIFAYPFLGCIFIGELLNSRFNKQVALSPYLRKHVLIAMVLTGISAILTPYLWYYPVSLIKMVFQGGGNIEELKSVAAYGSSLANPTYFMYFVIPIVMLVYVVAVTYKKSRIDWVFVLSNIAYAILYTVFNRLMYYWAPVYVLGILFYLKNDVYYFAVEKKKIKFALIVVLILFGFDQIRHNVYMSTINMPWYSWFGLGNSYMNSPEEVQYITKQYRDYKIANTYDCGGYLLWTLGPKKNIMIDPRYFPFREWYSEYRDVASGENIYAVDGLQSSDVFITGYKNNELYLKMLRMPGWTIDYYGTGGVVFVKKDMIVDNHRPLHGKNVYSCNNPIQAASIMQFALVIGDIQVAAKLLLAMKKRFAMLGKNAYVLSAEKVYVATKMYYQGEYSRAIEILEKLVEMPIYTPSRIILNNMYHYKTLEYWNEDDLRNVKRIISNIQTDDVYGMYNFGVVNWYLHYGSKNTGVAEYNINSGLRIDEQKWRQPLKRFLAITEDIPAASVPRKQVRKILNGSFQGKPFLIAPPQPPRIEFP